MRGASLQGAVYAVVLVDSRSFDQFRVWRVGSLTVVPAGSTASVGVQRSHTYAAGETLWDLAERYLGDPLRWPEIVAINPTKIKNPDRITPGAVLQIPRK